jgi:hypothetical protein
MGRRTADDAPQTLGASVAFARARHTVRPHAAAPRQFAGQPSARARRSPGGLIGQLGPFLILFAAAAYVGVRWEEIPAEFPTREVARHGRRSGCRK